MEYVLAIDIGASSGRHIIGWMENSEIRYMTPEQVRAVQAEAARLLAD